jgi:hypothetical protein
MTALLCTTWADLVERAACRMPLVEDGSAGAPAIGLPYPGQSFR